MPCKHCDGSGFVELSEHLRDTLSKFQPGKQLRACDVFDMMPFLMPTTINAINNRLEDLRAMGLLKRERRGRFYYYSRQTNP